MQALRDRAAGERSEAETRWREASREASDAAAWHEQAVGGTRWYWEGTDGGEGEEEQV